MSNRRRHATQCVVVNVCGALSLLGVSTCLWAIVFLATGVNSPVRASTTAPVAALMAIPPSLVVRQGRNWLLEAGTWADVIRRNLLDLNATLLTGTLFVICAALLLYEESIGELTKDQFTQMVFELTLALLVNLVLVVWTNRTEPKYRPERKLGSPR